MSAYPVLYCTHCGVMLRWLRHRKWLHPSTPCSLFATAGERMP